MARRRRVLAAGMTMLLAATAQAGATPLARFRWRSRVLLVFAPSADDAALQAQLAALAAAGPGLGERDLRVVAVVGDAPVRVDDRAEPGLGNAALRDSFGVPTARFAAVLVGKDGGEKLRAPAPLGTDQLFGTIDAMPMRRTEMRR